MNYKNFILILVAVFMFSCDTSFHPEEEFDLEILPGYVAFDAPGNAAVLDDLMTSEDEGTAILTIENPTGTLSDITVTYSFSGSAVFGEDFTVAGATATGGSIVLNINPADFQNNDRVDLEIALLTDDFADGEKMLTVTLASAENAEGTVAVGRGGTDFLKTATVVIADID